MHSKLKILFLTRDPYGTIGRPAACFVPLILATMGYAVKVLCFGDKYADKEQEPAVINVDYKLIQFTKVKAENLLARTLNIYQAMKSMRPDIIHIYSIPDFWFYPLILKLPVKMKDGLFTKWVFDVRSPPLRTNPINRWQRALWPLMQSGYDAICTHAGASAKSRFRELRKPLYIIPPGVDLARFKTRAWAKSEPLARLKKFVYVGSLARLRKLELFIEGISVAKNKLQQDSGFHVDFYGGGNALQELINKSRLLDLDETISFKGIIPYYDLANVLHKYDAGISFIPYEQYYDSPALKTLEYMAAGIFVLGSDTGGNRLFIENHVNGVLFANTKEGISEEIVNAVQQGLPLDYVSAGRAAVSAYDWKQIVKEKLLPMYYDLLADRSNNLNATA